MSQVFCRSCGKAFPLTRTYVDRLGTHTVCPHCKATFNTDEEVELNDDHLARNDEIYNEVYELCRVLTEDDSLEWSMDYIGEIVEAAAQVMAEHGLSVRYPSVVTDKNGSQHIEEYYHQSIKAATKNCDHMGKYIEKPLYFMGFGPVYEGEPTVLLDINPAGKGERYSMKAIREWQARR